MAVPNETLGRGSWEFRATLRDSYFFYRGKDSSKQRNFHKDTGGCFAIHSLDKNVEKKEKEMKRATLSNKPKPQICNVNLTYTTGILIKY